MATKKTAKKVTLPRTLYVRVGPGKSINGGYLKNADAVVSSCDDEEVGKYVLAERKSQR